ncbi:hypothetical protein PEC301296_24670 [Pectobacterium carotovorum subsp. carotovorum]|nr:hypothetical protein PEC301296_24670 [Pectobacterium carotovorum subsp. carotovorum]
MRVMKRYAEKKNAENWEGDDQKTGISPFH